MPIYKQRLQTDFISTLLSKLRIGNVLRYSKFLNLGDFDDDDIPNVRSIKTIVNGSANKKIILSKGDFTFDGTTLSHTFTTDELVQIGNDEPEAGLYELDTINGISNKFPFEPNFNHQANNIASPISTIYFVGLDQSVWDAGTFKVIVWAALALSNTPSSIGQVSYKEVATYADMIALGIPTILTVYKLNDGTNYNYWPDGVISTYGGGGGILPTYSFENTSGIKTKNYMNTTYPFAKTGDIVFQLSENQQYKKLDNATGGNWTYDQYQGLLT